MTKKELLAKIEALTETVALQRMLQRKFADFANAAEERLALIPVLSTIAMEARDKAGVLERNFETRPNALLDTLVRRLDGISDAHRAQSETIRMLQAVGSVLGKKVDEAAMLIEALRAARDAASEFAAKFEERVTKLEASKTCDAGELREMIITRSGSLFAQVAQLRMDFAHVRNLAQQGIAENAELKRKVASVQETPLEQAARRYLRDFVNELPHYTAGASSYTAPNSQEAPPLPEPDGTNVISS